MTGDTVERPERVALSAEGLSDDPFTVADWTLLAFVSLIWGASFLFIAEGLETMGPGMVVFFRLLFGVAVISLLPAARRTRIHRVDLPRVALIGVVWFAIPQTLFPIAEQWVSSAVAGMLNGALPVFSATFAAVVLRRAPGRSQLRGLAVGAVGIVAIGLPSIEGGSRTIIGVALILGALVCYAVAANLVVPLQQRYGAEPVIWRAQLVALALSVPYAAVDVGDSTLSWTSFGSVFALGALGTGLAFVAASTFMGRVGVTRGSVIAYLIPVVALALGVWLRGEHVDWLQVVGLGLVLVAAWLLSRRGR